MDERLPRRYVPSALRPVDLRERELVVYAVGLLRGPGEFGMTHGPDPELEKMLEVVPEDDSARLIRFNKDGTETVLYRWEREAWVLRSNPERGGGR